MQDDQFDKLFNYMQDFRAEVNDSFTTTNSRIDHLVNTLDAFAKRLDDTEIEQAARNA